MEPHAIAKTPPSPVLYHNLLQYLQNGFSTQLYRDITCLKASLQVH